MTEGKQSDIRELERVEIFEFYATLETWEADLDAKKTAWEKRKAKLKAKR